MKIDFFFLVLFHIFRFLDSLSHALISYLPKMSGLELLKAAHYLCGMNHFPSALLEQLLSSSTLEQLACKDNQSINMHCLIS